MQGSSPPPGGWRGLLCPGASTLSPGAAYGQVRPEPSTYLTRPQERPAHAAAPARAPCRPGVGAQPAAQPAPGLWRPRVPELRRAAAAGHGAVGAGAGGAAAARAPGGGGAGAHPAALADRAVAPAPRDPPRSDTRSGPCARRAAAGRRLEPQPRGRRGAPGAGRGGVRRGRGLPDPARALEAARTARSPCFAVS